MMTDEQAAEAAKLIRLYLTSYPDEDPDVMTVSELLDDLEI